MGIARALAKLGLVELSDKEQAELSADDATMSAAEIAELARSGSASMPADLEVGATGRSAATDEQSDEEVRTSLDDSRSFDAIYDLAQVPPSPFAADKLFKLLDGLGSLPADVRKQAVLAMDAAEDDWTIADSLVDAKRKIDVLQAEKHRVARAADQIVEQAGADVLEKEEYGKQATAEIRAQIADLEELLATELTKTAAECETLKRSAHDAQQSRDRAQKRYNEEIDRLTGLSALFGAEPEESRQANSKGD